MLPGPPFKSEAVGSGREASLVGCLNTVCSVGWVLRKGSHVPGGSSICIPTSHKAALASKTLPSGVLLASLHSCHYEFINFLSLREVSMCNLASHAPRGKTRAGKHKDRIL